jgi:Transglutaminase-like superfamily
VRGSARTVATVALVLATPLLARLTPLRLRRVLSYAIAAPWPRRASPQAARARVERAIGVAARLRPQTCLTRGISRYVVLRRAGLPVELVFGIGTPSGPYEGHCWLELDGAPYLEATDPRGVFPETFRIPGAG